MADDVIDLATFNELQDTVGEDFVLELVEAFFEEAPPMLAELRSAFDARDADSFRRAAHSLKTNANTFGAAALGAQAQVVELGGLPDDAGVLDALDACYFEATAALKDVANG
ncbi:MAG: HPt (histidine-containing phosphotransfer) domain-containing protein [Gammaproteobacteria bacterium]|jgi:HPt (histidine-containing phosphotransfer) domain-containing protein